MKLFRKAQQKLVLNLDGVSYSMQIKEGKLRIDGYDLENEVMALALSDSLPSLEIHMLLVMDDLVKKGEEKKLKKFIKEFHVWVSSNPRFILEPWGNPLCGIYEIHQELKHSRIRYIDLSNVSLDKWSLSLLLRSGDKFVQGKISGHPGLSLADLKMLLCDSESWLREAALEHPKLPSKYLEEAMESTSVSVWESICRNPNCSSEMLERMVEKSWTAWSDYRISLPGAPKPLLLQLVVQHPNTPDELASKLFTISGDEAMVLPLLKRTHLGDLRQMIMNHSKVEIRMAAAKGGRLTKEEEKAFMNDDVSFVRAALAENPSLSFVTRRKLAYDKVKDVKSAARISGVNHLFDTWNKLVMTTKKGGQEGRND